MGKCRGPKTSSGNSEFSVLRGSKRSLFEVSRGKGWNSSLDPEGLNTL